MKNDFKVVDVDPGVEKGGLNKVNELHAYQSYVIKCDQKDNMSLVLNTIKSSTGQTVTIKQSETDKSDEYKGTKYYLSVVPQIDRSSLIKKFTETFWACVYVFCINESKPKPFNWGTGYRGGDDMFLSADEDEGDEGLECGIMLLNMATRGSPQLCSLPAGCIAKGGIIPQSKGAQRNKSQSSKSMDNVIDNSSAARVTGRRYVEVRSGFTGKTYEFDRHSVRCALGLSVAEGLEFLQPPSNKELIEIGEAILTDVSERAMKKYRDRLTKVYESDQCVICLEDETKPDIILYACGKSPQGSNLELAELVLGHQCCHKNCVGKLNAGRDCVPLGDMRLCPLCRLTITSKLQA